MGDITKTGEYNVKGVTVTEYSMPDMIASRERFLRVERNRRDAERLRAVIWAGVALLSGYITASWILH